jgi:hypothetical protein
LLKSYFRYLTQEDRVRFQIELEKGQVRKFVVQYEILVADRWSAVTRFDTYHSAVHRDLVGPNGTVTKRWFVHLSFDEGLTFAYDDIEKNWGKYREWYLSKVSS